MDLLECLFIPNMCNSPINVGKIGKLIAQLGVWSEIRKTNYFQIKSIKIYLLLCDSDTENFDNKGRCFCRAGRMPIKAAFDTTSFNQRGKHRAGLAT